MGAKQHKHIGSKQESGAQQPKIFLFLTCEEAVEGWRYSLGLTATVVAILSCSSGNRISRSDKVTLHLFWGEVE